MSLLGALKAALKSLKEAGEVLQSATRLEEKSIPCYSKWPSRCVGDLRATGELGGEGPGANKGFYDDIKIQIIHTYIISYIYIWHSPGQPHPPPPRGWSWFPAPPPVGVGGVVVDGWECWLMES